MCPKKSQPTRVAQFLIASAFILAALILPTVNRAAGQLLTGITVAPGAPTIDVTQTQQFTATAHFDDGSQQPATGLTGNWASTGSMATSRYYHTATRLPDGSVLVAGGFNSASTFATAERWHPGTGAWTPAGTMSRARLAHTATLLPNGKVLVVGGMIFPSNAVTNTTEIYDPATNTWSAGPSLTLGVRAFHGAVALATGRVMVVAGVQSYPDCTYRTSAEIYNPATNSWAVTGSLHLARSNATTALLADGRVLLAGGPANNCPTPNNGMTEAEIYDPAAGSWSVLPSLSTARYSNFIAALPDGRALLAGGTPNGGITATAEIFNPATGTFAFTAPMATGRATSGGTGDNGTTVVLADGRVLVAGGHNVYTNTVFSSAELYDPSTSTWQATASMLAARTHNTITSLGNGAVLVVGGHGAGAVALASAEIYQPQVAWSSSNPAVATVDQNGLATAVAPGTTTITASSGSVSGGTTLTVAADDIPPATTAAYAAPNANGWHAGDVIVQLNASDSGGSAPPSGVQSITYSLSGAHTGGGTANGSSVSFTISNEGTTTIAYHAVDANGNIEPASTATIRIDRTRPTLSNLPNITVNATSGAGAVVTYAPVALDGLSGIDLVTVTQGPQSGATFPHGITNVEVTAVDEAGNSWSQSFTVIVNKTLTSIAVTPPSATINAAVNAQQFFATGSYTDGSSQMMGSGGGWTVAGASLATPRSYHTATRLPDGSVLVVGGYNHLTTSFASAERFYPSTHTWASAGSMAISRLGHTATLLPNGKVIVVGGRQHPGNTQTNTTEIYDPVSNSWSAGPSLTLGVREAHSAVLLNTGKLLVAAGLRSYPDCAYRASAELYDPATNSWSATGSLNLARSSATTVLLGNGKVLLAGGPQNGCPTPNVGMSQAEIYDPATGVWTVTGNLSVSRYANTITVLSNGKVMLAGGIGAPGAAVASADIYDPASGTFSPTGSMATARVTSVGTGDNGVTPRLADGRVLVAGGHNPWTGAYFSSSELFDPVTGTWSPTGSLNTARTNYTTTLLDDGRILAVGGIGPGAVSIGSAEIYTPPAMSWLSSTPGVATIDQLGVATGAADGTTTITASVGAISGTAALTVDRTAPVTTAAPSPSPNVNGWHKTDVQVALNAGDGANGTGVQSIAYSYNGSQFGGPFNAPGNSASVTIFNDGTTTLNYHAVDNAGNAEGDRSLTIRIDRSLPFLSYPNQIQAIASSGAGAVVHFNVSANDNLSGLSGPVTVSPLQSGAMFPIGTTTQTVTATDNAGNTATATFDVIVAPGDSTPPTTNANYSGPNANGWNRFNVSVTLNAFDSSNQGSPSGVNSITYSLSGAQTGGGTFQTSNTSFTISNEGTTTVTYHATDNRGNVEADRTFTVKLDKTQPTAANLSNIQVSATSTSGAIVNFNLAAADALSGVDTVVFTQGLASGSLFPHGTTNQSVTITDKAGNTASRSFSVTVNKTLLSISVSPSNATVDVGDSQFFSAMGHFTSGPDQLLSTGGGGTGSGGGGGGSSPSARFWNIHFTPGLDVSACGGAGGGFSSQAFSVNSSGVINSTQWSPGTPRVNVTGQVTANVEATLTISCIDNPNITVTATLPWQTTSFDGSITFSGQTTNAHVTGWSSQPQMPTAAFASGAATVGNRVYVVGGGINGAPSGLVQVFDLTTRTWLAPAASMAPREGPGVAALNGYIYAAGGHMPGGDATTTLQRFDPVANQWVTLAPMPGPRAELQLVAANGMLYAIGGTAGNASNTPLATVERYDPVTNEWAARASMSSPRMFFAAGALNNETTIIVAGGSGGSSVELYNIGTNSWSATSPVQASMAAGATIANRFYVATQCGSFVYRPADGNQNEGWAIMPGMLNPRGEFAVAVSGDTIYAAGGFTGATPSSPLATFDALSTPPPSDLAYNQAGASGNCGGGGGGGSTTPTVQWSSSDPSIAGINSSGSATGNAPGQATIIATAAGISCATTNSCGTLTVNQPTYLTFTLAPGSAPFDVVTVTLVDRVSGEVFDTFDVPIGEPQEVSAEEADQVRLVFTAPAGYQVSPSQVEPNLHNGDLIIPLMFTDAAPPEITAPADITAEATSADGASVDPGEAIATDLIGPVTITRVPADNQFALGTTTITWRATDGAGNFSEATQQVTVVDTTAPAITAPAGVTAEATSAAGAVVDPGQATASDLVGPVTITRLPAGNQFALGTTTITWRATDGAGNFSEATQQVTVVDTTPPVLSLPGNIIVDATNPQGAIVTYSASAADSVGGSLVVTCSTASGSTFPIGTTTVACAATDAAGNPASGTFTVLVQAAAAQVSQLIVTVQTFNLQQGIANSLDAKLTNVLNALNGATSGNTAAVCNQLGAFINETMAQSGKKLTVAQADQLIAAAQQIQAVIGCQ